MTGFESKRQMAKAKLDDDDNTQVYTTPTAQRQWVGLTEDDYKGMSAGDKLVAMWAERTFKERNT